MYKNINILILLLIINFAWAEAGNKKIGYPHKTPVITTTKNNQKPRQSKGGHGSARPESGSPGGGSHGGGGGAHNGKSSGKKHGEDHKNNHESETETHYDDDYSFWGSVRWSDSAVIAGNRKLVGDNPWLNLLAPGMRIEARGEVDEDKIEVEEIVIHHPHSWSFYEGPARLLGLKGGWVKAWFQGDNNPKIYKQIIIKNKNKILLAACYHSDSWRALPAQITIGPTPSSWGWWLLEGSETKGGLYWRFLRKLPGSCY